LDQENFRIGEVSRLAYGPLETPTFGMNTRAPRLYDEPIRDAPVLPAVPPPMLPNAAFSYSVANCRQSSPSVATCRQPSFPSTYSTSTCALANNHCSPLPTTSTVIPNATYYPSVPVKEESPPSSPEISYPQFIDATYSRSPLANSLPDLNLRKQRNRKTSRYDFSLRGNRCHKKTGFVNSLHY
uniref:GAB2 n=1 Tax=Angiostrongylus cantonensis TaxID=6313 RepID=A0A0K0DJB6_ANGCA